MHFACWHLVYRCGRSGTRSVLCDNMSSLVATRRSMAHHCRIAVAFASLSLDLGVLARHTSSARLRAGREDSTAGTREGDRLRQCPDPLLAHVIYYDACACGMMPPSRAQRRCLSALLVCIFLVWKHRSHCRPACSPGRCPDCEPNGRGPFRTSVASGVGLALGDFSTVDSHRATLTLRTLLPPRLDQFHWRFHSALKVSSMICSAVPWMWRVAFACAGGHDFRMSLQHSTRP